MLFSNVFNAIHVSILILENEQSPEPQRELEGNLELYCILLS